MNGETTNFDPKTSASVSKPSVQTTFVESCVREGWRILDVQMWQNLCKKLATCADDSELAMMILLGIADEHGINPIQLCAYARDEGFKALEMDAIQHLAQMYGIEEEIVYGDDDYPEATQVEEDDDDKSSSQEDEPKRKSSSAKRHIAFPDEDF